MLSVIDILFGWLPDILAMLCRVSLLIFLGYTVFLVVRFVKQVIPFL